MTRQQPTQHWLFCLGWVGLSFLVGVAAQTPAPQTPTKPAATSAPPALNIPSVPSTENGTQLVRKAEVALQQQSNPLQAIVLYETAAHAFHQSGELEAEALAWHRVSQLAARAGRPYQGRTAAEKARTLLHVRTLPTRSSAGLSTSQAARAYLTLGRIHIESGEVKEAVDAYQAGLALAMQSRLSREAAAGHVALGRIVADTGDLDNGIRMTNNSLDYWRAARDFSGEALALNNLARFYERKGDLKLAAEFDAQAIQVARFSRDYLGEGASLNEAMRLHMLLGNHDAAAQACEHLIGLSRLRGNRKQESEQSLSLALIEAQRDQLPSAYQLLLRAFILGADSDKELGRVIKTFIGKLETVPKPANVQREQLIADAEFEAKRGDYSAAYQLLLRALVMNEGKSDVTNVPLNAWIKTLAKQIEAQQKKPRASRP